MLAINEWEGGRIIIITLYRYHSRVDDDAEVFSEERVDYTE